MKLLLFADNKVGLEVTRFLLKQYPEDIAIVVTTEENEIYQLARNANVQARVFESAEELTAQFESAEHTFDLGILAWWPKIIKTPLLSLPKLGYINFHPSLLPFNRGKHYNFWALVENVPFGVSLHFVDENVDTGDIVAQLPIPYDWTDNGGTLYYKAQEEILSLFQESYPILRSLDIPRRKQDLSKGSSHLASELEMASRIVLDRDYSGRELLNLLRARTFAGYPSCWFEDGDEKFEVRIDIRRVDK